MVRELFEHHCFFVNRFNPETGGDEEESKEAADVPVLDRGSEDEGEHASVDWMADQPVGAAHDQFVIFFQSNRAAPVASENGSGPETEAKSSEAEDGSGNKQGVGVRDDAEVERARKMGATKKEPAADYDRQDVSQTLRAGLTIDGSLGEDRR